MRKAERLFQLVNALRAKQPVTAQSLASELGVSVRSIYRYIDDLSVSGIPIYGEPGVGYRLDEAFELRPLTLTPGELDALLLGTQMVSASTGTMLTASARTLLSKICASLPEQSGLETNRWAYALTVTERSGLSARWDMLHDAVCSRRVLHFRYVTPSQERSQREVWPLGLFYWGGKWTLGAWCVLRNAFRDFRLDRMSEVKLLPHRFELTDAINLDRYMSQQAKAWTKVRRSTDTTLSVGEE
ncbi:DNA-binding transcriptional regulator [Alkalilimnicola ehrlichii]|uniref:DNA-binding transcriptional regulator n=1 Tax=Alkalilimnicola ehrlichii TaxID=351052 RepID=A0A3E0X397_9GAMM|nr:YafY family protein [Alkalilimnicola ehrlichii]RFA31408.1 DNA-binding transcriptional regulator [Alkalilimnicola ehrlichii]RFA39320.1 DNA-binding transcriptional regulator [Alkalilimnicola ehrlichii]